MLFVKGTMVHGVNNSIKNEYGDSGTKCNGWEPIVMDDEGVQLDG